MYIIDRLEHGNCGVYGSAILDELPLEECLKKTPFDYGVDSKEWGFWPVISENIDIDDYLYFWDEDKLDWVERE
jgi:hypothetical protein